MNNKNDKKVENDEELYNFTEQNTYLIDTYTEALYNLLIDKGIDPNDNNSKISDPFILRTLGSRAEHYIYQFCDEDILDTAIGGNEPWCSECSFEVARAFITEIGSATNALNSDPLNESHVNAKVDDLFSNESRLVTQGEGVPLCIRCGALLHFEFGKAVDARNTIDMLFSKFSKHGLSAITDSYWYLLWQAVRFLKTDQGDTKINFKYWDKAASILTEGLDSV